ncbi:MAG: hypothetical protein LBD29_02925 [Treponema sp.]|jgi:chromosome segregation ATPase|nr:hypothetical protein [Treponema sp.]
MATRKLYDDDDMGMDGVGPVVVFDPSSGISEAEQKDILSEIDEIAAQNRLQPSSADLQVKAQKKGLLFPVLVNGIALLLLGGGLFGLFFFHQQETLKFQEGTSYIGLTERQLIQEIRKETSAQISVKDREIADVLAALADINRQLHNLQQSIDKRIQEKEAELRRQMEQEITAERQRLAAENLSEHIFAERIKLFEEQKQLWLNAELAALKRQLEEEQHLLRVELQSLREEYLNTLALLQGERTRVLEDARIREENLQLQLVEKTNELNALYEESRQALGTARDEFYRLTDEWERSALIEGELSGFYTTANNQIRDGHLQEASNTLMAMREFLDTPGFQQLRPVQSRKEFYLASINVLSEIIAGGLWGNSQTQTAAARTVPIETLPQGADPIDDAELEALRREYAEIIGELKTQNAALEQTLAEREQTILAFEQQQYINQQPVPADYGEVVNTLRSQNAALQQNVATFRSQNTTLQQNLTTLKTQNTNQQQTINTLRAQNTNLQQTVTTRDSSINTLRTQNANLQQILSAHENTIREFRTQNETFQQTLNGRDSTINDLRTQNTNLQQTANDLRTQNTNLQQTANDLRTQNTNLQQTANDLRTQTANFQQTLNGRDSTINDLRTQNTNLQQTLNGRENIITDLRTQTVSLQQSLSARDSTISDLRTQTTNLQQTLNARENIVSDLRTQNTNLQQTVTDLRTQNTNLNQTVDQLRQTNEAVRKLLGTQ